MDSTEFEGETRRSMEVGRRMRRGGIVYHQLSDILSSLAMSPIPEVSNTESQKDLVKSPPTPDLPSDHTRDQGQCSSKSVHTQAPKFTGKSESSSSSGRLDTTENSFDDVRFGGDNHKLVARKEFQIRSKNTDATKLKTSKKNCKIQ